VVVFLGREGVTLWLKKKKKYIMKMHVVVSKSEVGAILHFSEESFMFMGLNVNFATQ